MLSFHGGTLGALTPFAVFLSGAPALAFAGAPDERGFWPVLLLALVVGLVLAKDRARYAEAMLDGMGQRIVMIMLCAWLFASVLGTLLAASGFVGALAWSARALELSGGAYVGAAFVASALVATATGTSFGTILVAGPLLYPAGGAAGAAPAALIGAILAGATWGDSMSPVSDTTIASSGTQGADIGGTVRSRLRYALPAGLLALAVSVLLGGRASGASTIELPSSGGPLPLVMFAVPALVIAMLLLNRHLIESLLVGIVAAALVALTFGLFAPSALLRVEPGAFGASGLIVDGFNRAIGVSIFTLLLMALVGTIQATDLLERLVRAVERRASTTRIAEAWIVGTVSAAVLLTAHSVVAVLMTGPFAKETGERHGLSAYRRANLLDLTVCTWPFLLPWFLPTILASGATRDGGGFGMPALSPLTVGLHNTYAWALVGAVGIAVLTGYGRAAASLGKVPLVIALMALLSDSLGAQSPAPTPAADKVIVAHALGANETLTLDGVLSEGIWQRIQSISDFRMQEPVEGGQPSERTEIRIAYDADYLYIGAMLYDSDPSGIKAFQKRWDQSLSTDDRFMWILDTFNDQRNAYFFEINPAGLMGDGLVRTGQGTNVNKAWTGIWRAWTSVGTNGWSAEIRIPFRTLNFNPASESWGINFQRTIRRKNEELLWAGERRSQGLWRPQNAGKLVGLREPSQGLGLEFVPYALGRQSTQRVPTSTSSLDSRVGVDINYSITPNLRAGLTFNTDFAETEVDDRQVNLTRFPLVFPERRAFFLEGSSVFNFAPASSPNPFFSRRIGLADGEPLTVLGGARLIGRLGQQDLGMLHLRTAGDGPSSAVEDFSVLRVSRNIFRESSIGMLYTRRASSDDAQPDAHTLGADLELGTSRFMGNKNLQLQAFAVYHNDATPDGSTSSLADRSVRGARINFPNRPWDAHISYREFGDAYDPAVGFAPRVGFRRTQPSITWRPLVPQVAAIRELTFEWFNEYLSDDRWRPLTVNNRITPLGIRFESGDLLTTQLLWNFEYLDAPFDILRDGRFVMPVGQYPTRGARVQMQSAAFRRIVGTVALQRAGFWTGTRDDTEASVTVRPFAGTNITANWVHNRARLPGGGFEAQVYRLFSSFDFTPLVSLNLNVQYDNVSRLLGAQNRLTWILTPGNTMYFVYQHNWRNPLDDRLQTLQQQANLKLAFTQRF